MIKKTKVLFLLLTTAYLYSCKDEYTICNLSKNVNFIAGFYQKSGSADVATTVSGLSIQLLDGSGGAIYNNATLQSFSLGLNPNVDSMRYVVTMGANPIDTLTIVYKTQGVKLSEECGNVFYNHITKLYTTKHTLDSARIINADVNTNPLENGRIYF